VIAVFVSHLQLCLQEWFSSGCSQDRNRERTLITSNGWVNRVAIPLADAADKVCIIVASLCEFGWCIDAITSLSEGVRETKHEVYLSCAWQLRRIRRRDRHMVHHAEMRQGSLERVPMGLGGRAIWTPSICCCTGKSYSSTSILVNDKMSVWTWNHRPRIGPWGRRMGWEGIQRLLVMSLLLWDCLVRLVQEERKQFCFVFANPHISWLPRSEMTGPCMPEAGLIQSCRAQYLARFCRRDPKSKVIECNGKLIVK
jgi:hypothetical protein